ncbi:hypothetical protein [Leptospira sp. 'Mane']|uniref:hypothetical protein n=1 Tax=Leptospira sp. 'Mane' TaxID=3387407 RepID=UPI00398AB733
MSEYEIYIRDIASRYKTINSQAPDFSSVEYSYEQGWITKEEFQATEREAGIFISKKEELTREYYSRFPPKDKTAMEFFDQVKDRLHAYETKGNEYLKRLPDDPKEQGFNLALLSGIKERLNEFLNHKNMGAELGWLFWTALEICDIDEGIFEL